MFLETALSFPTVLFTVAVLVTVGYWLLSLLSGLGDSLDLDLDLDADLDGVDGGALASLMAGLHLTGVPSILILSLTATFGWLVSYSIAVVLGLPEQTGLTAVLGGVGLTIGAMVAGLLAASVVGRPIARLFTYTRATSHAVLVGRIGTVRTGSVSEGFGQAEVRTP